MSAARSTIAVPAAPVEGRGRRLRGWLTRNRRALGYALFTAAVFVVALVYTLPHDLIARRALDQALAEAPVEVSFREVGFAFPNGYRFDGVTVTSTELAEARLPVEAMTVRAPLRGLVTGVPSAEFAGQIFGGEVDGSAVEQGAGAAIDLRLRDVDLARAASALFPAYVQPPSRISGRADIDVQLAGDGRTTRSSQGRVELDVRDLGLTRLVVEGITLPDLGFDRVTGSAEIKGTRLELKALRADGPEADLTLEGDVLLREPTPQSVLNLELVVEVAPNAQPAVRMATAFLPPKPAGQPQRWTIRGTLARPIVK